MKYIIMCGGNYVSFETPRQLIKVMDDESLVERTIRLLGECGVLKDDIFISSNNPVFESFGVRVLHHTNNFTTRGYEDYDKDSGWWVDAFYPTEEEACYLMGDVFYSPAAIKTIISSKRNELGARFFGSTKSHARSRYYFKNYAEPFGFKIWDQLYFRSCIEKTKENAKRGMYNRHPIAWELWGTVAGKSPLIAYDNYDVICDYTCDVDAISDIEPIRERVKLYLNDMGED